MSPFDVFRPWERDVDSASVVIEVGERIVLELTIQVGLHEERVTCLETNSELKGPTRAVRHREPNPLQKFGRFCVLAAGLRRSVAE